MRVLAIERPIEGVANESFTPELLAAEAAQAWQLYQAGLIRELYFRDDEDSAVLSLECATVDDARNVLAGLPLVTAGLIDFEILPLRPYPGFGRLFASPPVSEPQSRRDG